MIYWLLLHCRLRSLPTEASDVGAITLLPSESVQLPRTTRAPEPKPETKWEKFAREKGIQKKKKDRMVYEETTGEYKPRFGYQRGNNGLEDMPIVEVKAGEDPFADPWAADRKSKKERIDKNKKSQMRNVAQAEKIKAKGKKNFDPAMLPGIPVDMTEGKKKGKAGVRNTLQLVQHSTASMGR
jgi:regulator of ribosome biosynthesis